MFMFNYAWFCDKRIRKTTSGLNANIQRSCFICLNTTKQAGFVVFIAIGWLRVMVYFACRVNFFATNVPSYGWWHEFTFSTLSFWPLNDYEPNWVWIKRGIRLLWAEWPKTSHFCKLEFYVFNSCMIINWPYCLPFVALMNDEYWCYWLQ